MDSNTSQGMRLGGISFSCVSWLGMFSWLWITCVSATEWGGLMIVECFCWFSSWAIRTVDLYWFQICFMPTVSLLGGGGSGFRAFRPNKKKPSFGFGKTGGSLRGFSWKKKIPKLMVLCGGAWLGSFWGGPCMWFGCPYAMGSRSWGDQGLVSGGLPDILGDFGGGGVTRTFLGYRSEVAP